MFDILKNIIRPGDVEKLSCLFKVGHVDACIKAVDKDLREKANQQNLPARPKEKTAGKDNAKQAPK